MLWITVCCIDAVYDWCSSNDLSFSSFKTTYIHLGCIFYEGVRLQPLAWLRLYFLGMVQRAVSDSQVFSDHLQCLRATLFFILLCLSALNHLTLSWVSMQSLIYSSNWITNSGTKVLLIFKKFGYFSCFFCFCLSKSCVVRLKNGTIRLRNETVRLTNETV